MGLFSTYSDKFCVCDPPNFISLSNGSQCMEVCELAGCDTCIGLYSAGIGCDSCASDYTLNNHICCPSGSYFVNDTCSVNCPKDHYAIGLVCCPDGTLFQDGQCVTSCSSGYRALNSVTCCQFGQVLQDTACVQKCSSGYSLNSQSICVPEFPKPPEQQTVNRNYSETVLMASTVTKGITGASAGALAAAGSAQPNFGASMFLVLLGIDSIMILKFVNIRYADYNYAIFDSMSGFFPDWLSPILGGNEITEEDYVIGRGSFAYQETTGLFLKLNGDKGTELILWTMAAFLITFLKKKAEKSTSNFWKRLLTRADEFMHYTIYLSIIFGGYMEFLIGILLNLEIFSSCFSSFYTSISAIAAILTLVGLAGLIVVLFKSLNRVFKEKQVGKSYMTEENRQLMAKINLIHGEMSIDDKYQYFFFFFIVIKQNVTVFALVWLQKVDPKIQILVLFLFSVGYITAIIQVKPFSEGECTFVSITNEISVMLLLILAFVQTFFDQSDISVREKIGNWIVGIITLNILMNLTLAFRMMFLSIKAVWFRTKLLVFDENLARSEKFKGVVVTAITTLTLETDRSEATVGDTSRTADTLRSDNNTSKTPMTIELLARGDRSPRPKFDDIPSINTKNGNNIDRQSTRGSTRKKREAQVHPMPQQSSSHLHSDSLKSSKTMRNDLTAPKSNERIRSSMMMTPTMYEGEN